MVCTSGLYPLLGGHRLVFFLRVRQLIFSPSRIDKIHDDVRNFQASSFDSVQKVAFALPKQFGGPKAVFWIAFSVSHDFSPKRLYFLSIGDD